MLSVCVSVCELDGGETELSIEDISSALLFFDIADDPPDSGARLHPANNKAIDTTASVLIICFMKKLLPRYGITIMDISFRKNKKSRSCKTALPVVVI